MYVGFKPFAPEMDMPGIGAWPLNLINLERGLLIVGFPVPLVLVISRLIDVVIRTIFEPSASSVFFNVAGAFRRCFLVPIRTGGGTPPPLCRRARLGFKGAGNCGIMRSYGAYHE